MSFKTLDRQNQALNPSSTGPHYPHLANISAPHVESFNSIFDGSASILEKAIQEIGMITVFDAKQEETSPNKIECKFILVVDDSLDIWCDNWETIS